MLQACPTHQVATGGRTYCMVSYIPSPAVTEPPGWGPVSGREREIESGEIEGKDTHTDRLNNPWHRQHTNTAKIAERLKITGTQCNILMCRYYVYRLDGKKLHTWYIT